MPIYEYTCSACEASFERLVKSMSDAAKPTCPKCGSKKTARRMSVFAVSSAAAKSGGAEPPGLCGRCGGPGPCALDG